jgi:hypothetical protein
VLPMHEIFKKQTAKGKEKKLNGAAKQVGRL